LTLYQPNSTARTFTNLFSFTALQLFGASNSYSNPGLYMPLFNCAPKYNTFISSVSYFDTINQLRCNVFPSLLVGLNDSYLQLPFASLLSTIRHITFNSTSYQCCNSMLNIYLNFPSTSQRSHSIYKPVNSILLLFFTYH